VRVPASVTSLGHGVFQGCLALTSARVPPHPTDGLSVCATAFQGCPSLAFLTVADSVRAVGDDAFAGCVSVKSVELPASVTSIGEGAWTPPVA